MIIGRDSLRKTIFYAVKYVKDIDFRHQLRCYKNIDNLVILACIWYNIIQLTMCDVSDDARDHLKIR